MGRVFVAILAVFLLLGAFAPSINDGIKGWRTEDTTQNDIVATGAGVTTANVTLTSNLYRDNVVEVITVTSNITETPVATSYTEASNIILVSALTANTTRTITTNYYADSDSTVMAAVGPFLGIMIFGALLLGIFMASRKGKRG